MSENVIVVGAGIAGLSAARELRRAGFPTVLVEQRISATSEGFAFNLPGNGVRALAELGLGDLVAHAGRPIRRREYRTDTGRLLFAVDEDRFWGADACPHVIRRSDLLRALGEPLYSAGVVLGRRVMAVRTEDRRVAVDCDDGSTLTGRLVVGADGIHSRTRRAVTGSEAGRSRALLASSSWRFIAPNFGIDCWSVWVGPASTILLIPLSETEVYAWVSSASECMASVAHAPDLRAAFKAFPDVVRRTVAAAMEQAESIVHSPIEEVRISQWWKDRVVLVGDAAHATAPVWAQGAALAMEDAIVLARSLASHTDQRSALQAYEEARRPRIAHVQAMTDRMSRSAKLPAWIRSLVMPMIGPATYRRTYDPLRSAV